ncbi:MAG: MBL fold metallo-hydrolase [Spirochaetaceae bacterium]|nr:MBL fold metallo-hydrolase [Spirochaetaceae bacterium]
MILKSSAPIEINSSVYWLGSTETSELLQVNIYLILRGNEAFLLDPGPVPTFKKTFEAFQSICDIKKLKSIIVSHQDPDVCASLPLWEQNGFHGVIAAHWKTGLLLPSFGLNSMIVNIPDDETPLEYANHSIQFITMPFVHSPGAIGTYDSMSKTLFSGDLFGAVGKNMTLYSDDKYNNRMIFYHKTYMPSSISLNETLKKLEQLQIDYICPQHGSIHTKNIREKIDILKNIQNEYNESAAGSDLEEIISELDELRKSNFSLKENIILRNDDKLLDSVTGLYNTIYYNKFLPIFINENSNGIIAYIRLDEMQQFNNRHNYSEGDQAISVFASIFMENKPEKCLLFRTSGPILILLIPDSKHEQGKDIIWGLQQLVTESDGFIEQMTCSAALVNVNEYTNSSLDLPDFMKSVILTRLKILDKMGNNSICDSVATVKDFTKAKSILILEMDSFNASMLKDFFKNRNYAVEICSEGSKALHVIDMFRPSVILSEIKIPQLDIFLIREKLLNTQDLKNIPLILISHLKTEATIKQAFELQIRHYLKKPVSLVELSGLVDVLIEELDDN